MVGVYGYGWAITIYYISAISIGGDGLAGTMADIAIYRRGWAGMICGSYSGDGLAGIIMHTRL
jgi:hypothetical protein